MSISSAFTELTSGLTSKLGQVGGFAVNQSFLFGTSAYVVIPSLMVFCTLVLQPRLSRIANIALSIVYIGTIVASALGEWSYYVLGSVVEVALLAAIVYYAWTWPKQPASASQPGREPCNAQFNNFPYAHDG
jgi:energy-coupling factor transporter transmembrane protein EcfT